MQIFNRLWPQALPLRLRPRANKNLHMPLGYSPGILLQNI
ncbi:hypothetical protein T03_15824 [Trichinella britovi]|uniref:Uncharacterized protein n=1 Tax=Trichinella britovi TaxID=45882 RepID=A0A0V0ZBF7_TRIBR|nr:hypothetical protein T03_15824 [Trichinella britovi]